MEKGTVECPYCGWQGYEEDLQVRPDLVYDDIDVMFMHCCPECGSEEIGRITNDADQE